MWVAKASSLLKAALAHASTSRLLAQVKQITSLAVQESNKIARTAAGIYSPRMPQHRPYCMAVINGRAISRETCAQVKRVKCDRSKLSLD